jgi:hypothetical protein
MNYGESEQFHHRQQQLYKGPRARELHRQSDTQRRKRKMPAKIKLTYFDVRGRAEVSRLILAQAGVAYEDHRIGGEQWAKLKPSK